jgi:hypothetical protein
MSSSGRTSQSVSDSGQWTRCSSINWAREVQRFFPQASRGLLSQSGGVCGEQVMRILRSFPIVRRTGGTEECPEPLAC